jgi:hypothetical protein
MKDEKGRPMTYWGGKEDISVGGTKTINLNDKLSIERDGERILAYTFHFPDETADCKIWKLKYSDNKFQLIAINDEYSIEEIIVSGERVGTECNIDESLSGLKTRVKREWAEGWAKWKIKNADGT